MNNELPAKTFSWIRRHKILTVFSGLVAIGLVTALGNAQKAAENPLLPPVVVPQARQEQTRNATTESPVAQAPTPTPAAYQQLGHEKLDTVENFFFLVPTGLSEQEAETMAREIKQSRCSMPCNITLYDDRKAGELEIQYTSMTNIEERIAWKAQHEAYVADHAIGFLIFDTSDFTFYPNK